MREGAVRFLAKFVLVLLRVLAICVGIIGFVVACAVTEGLVVVVLFFVMVVCMLYNLIWG